VITHAILLVAVVAGRARRAPRGGAPRSANIVPPALSALGATLSLFVRAYSMGGGTYTGIEAVSNGVAIMREPRVQTAKRTMVLMATSLAITAGGILLCYLLVGLVPVSPRTRP
jgi:amino acid transporter